MFEARKLPSEGGVWVDGLLSDGERFSIKRLAAGMTADDINAFLKGC